jgi:hypothetical protein
MLISATRSPSLLLRFFFSLLCILVFCVDATSTTLRALSLADLSQGCDLVVIGKATSKQSLRDASGRIVTDVTYRVEQYVVGEGPPDVVIRVQGGQLGNLGRHVWGTARLEISNPTLLFLEKQSFISAPLIRVRGMVQGVFNVVIDQDGTSRYATRSLDSINLVGEQDRDTLTHSNTSVFIPLDEFIDQIRKLVTVAPLEQTP